MPRTVYAIAVLIYGALSLVGLFTAGIYFASTFAIICALLATGTTYLFQAIVYIVEDADEPTTQLMTRPTLALQLLQLVTVLLWLAGTLSLILKGI